jgi:hypothetical protein
MHISLPLQHNLERGRAGLAPLTQEDLDLNSRAS